jgi:glutamate-1-semialdehyde 2,1-aminomutase
VREATKLCESHGVPVSTTQVGAMFSLFFVEGGVTCFKDVCQTDSVFFNRFFWAMLEAGVYLAPSPFEASFTSTCHGPQELAFTLNALDYALKKATHTLGG